MGHSGFESRSAATVVLLIESLENMGLAPTIARNYEQFPRVGHDLDLFVEGGLDQAVAVFRSVADRLGWDLLTFCTHYATSRHDVLRIFIFRFHHLEPSETLQTDLFGGLILLGLPLATREELCRQRRGDSSGRFRHIDPVVENGYRLFQIQSLNPAETDKIERYRQRALKFDRDHHGALAVWSKNHHLGDLTPALEALRDGELIRFRRLIKASKWRFAFARLLNEPFRSTRLLWDRYRGLRRQMVSDPCGPTLRLAGPLEDWRPVLDRTVEAQFLPGWTEDEPRLQERGCALVLPDPKGIPFMDPGQAYKALLEPVLRRHTVLRERTNARCTPADR